METIVCRDIYTGFAALLDYPMGDLTSRIDDTVNIFGGDSQYPPEVLTALKDFKAAIAYISLDELQETYSYTFEMSSDYTLDLGHHVLDGFKRAEKLVNIKTMYRKYNFPFETLGRGELPDHLPLVLRFMGFVEDEEVKRDFRRDFVIKALEKLNKNFTKNQENPYSPAINAVYRVIDRDVKEVE